MKKKFTLLFVALLTVAAIAATQVAKRASATMVWDFSEFEDAQASKDLPNPYDYNGLQLVMAYVEGKDYFGKNGFHPNGNSSASNRHIVFTPTNDGVLTVTYRSNNSSANDRITAIGTEVKNFKTAEEAPASVLAFGFTEGSTPKTISAQLSAGTTYYIFLANGGQTITKLEYEYEEGGLPSSGDLSAIINDYIAQNPDQEAYVFNLPAGGNYTISAPIELGKSISIIGDATNPATIDASELKGDNAIIKLTPVTEATWLDHIVFSNVNWNIATRLVYANKQKYWIQKLLVDNCIIAVDGTFKKSIFDCNGGGNVKYLQVNKSTIYANPKVGQNGGFFSSQSSQKPTEFGENETQTFEITNSTLYNITNGNDMCTLREKDKAYNTFILTENIIVNCGKNKQFFKGFAGGSDAKKATWNVDKNTIFWGGVDVSGDETVKGTNDEVKNSVHGDPGFADPENGDFTVSIESDQNQYQIGDPRWLQDTSGVLTIALASGSDIGAEMEQYKQYNLTSTIIILEENGKYTSSAPIYVGGTLNIKGADGAEIDASSNNGPFIQMKPLPVAGLNEYGAYEIDKIAINNVKLTGVKNRLFYADRQNYLIKNLTVDNSIIQIDGATPRSIFDFYCGGNYQELSITNSTLYADPSNSQRGGLISTQSSKSVIEMGGPSMTQKLSIKHSTLYNIAYGKTPVLQESHSKKYLFFEVLDNIIANCGEPGEFVAGLNEGQHSDEPSWAVENNNFSFDGMNSGLGEIGGIQVTDVPVFKDAADGDFTLSIYCTPFERGVGDPLWLTPDENSLIVNVANGQDLSEVFAVAKGDKNPSDVLVILEAGAQLKITKPIVVGGNFVMKSSKYDAPATIDASELTEPFILLSETPAVEVINDYYRINELKIHDVNVMGLKNSIIYDNNKKYCVVNLGIDGTLMQLATEEVKNEALISFQGGGVKDLGIVGCTFYGNNDVAKYFVRYNNSARLDRYGFDTKTDFQTMLYSENTFYGLLKEDGQWGNYNGIAGQNYSKFDITGNIWYNCGKDIVRRLAGGRFGSNAPLNFNHNTYFNEGVDNSESESSYDKSGTILTSDPKFRDPANGKFYLGLHTEQNENITGDDRWWTFEVQKELDVPNGSDIGAYLEAELATLTENDVLTRIKLELEPGGQYTTSKSIVSPNEIVVSCISDRNPATIDASALDDPFIVLSTTPTAEFVKKADGSGYSDYYDVDGVMIFGVNIKGLKNSIFWDSNIKYCVENFFLYYSNIELATEATKNQAFISFQGGGAKTFVMRWSTVYQTGAEENNYFLRYNNSARLDRYGFDKETDKQSVVFAKNTFYNVGKNGQWCNYNGMAGQKYSRFSVINNIWFDCGSGQVPRRILGGRAASSYDECQFDNNTYWFNGAPEANNESYDTGVQLTTDPMFKDAGNGDFTIGASTQQAEKQTGDPRWLVEYIPTSIKSVDAEEIDLENAIIYNMNGQRVDKAQKGLYIINGRKVVVK